MSDLIDGRLPQAVIPTRYDLTLSVEPDEGRFSGAVSIHVQVREAVRSLTLHALDLQIARAVVEAGGSQYHAAVSADPATETITCALNQTIPVGHATVSLVFSGRLNRQMKGLYEATAGTERYAFTQFEATDARRAFPCFDEPGLKASFRITAVIPDHLQALSNMGVEEERVDTVTRRKRVVFAETPPMSTYLVALAVARLNADETAIDGTKVAIYYTRPEHAALTGFAGEVMTACLPRLNEYFGLRYPTAKLDLVAVPDFAAGAMENWGAIFFRENRLLVDSSKASAATLRAVANVITHEVVHQWFGNLVTMRWWEDLWLNESFATWLACKVVDDWRPEWLSWVEFAGEKQVPLGVDALASTRPVSSKVRTAAEAEEMFDPLTYEKGASVLRMLEQFLGEEAFRRGIRSYIADHRFGNAAAADLWEALAKASGRPVPAIAHDWFTKPGLPMVSVRATGSEFRTLQIAQARFVADPGWTPPAEPPWAIPLSLSFEDEAGVQGHRVLMTESRIEVTLPARGRVRWVYANAGEQGYYRTQYDQALREALASSVARLSPEERFGLLDNTWALMHKGAIPIADFLGLVTRFRGDVARIVVEGLAGYLEILGDRLVTESDRPRFATFTEEFFHPSVEALGWEARPNEGDEPKLARAAMLWAIGSVARPRALVNEMAGRLERYWADPASLDPTLVAAVIRLCARAGDSARGRELYERYVQRYRTAATPEERDRYLIAFGDFAEPSLTPAILNLVLSEAVRGQDIWKPLRGLLANPATQAETWIFIKANWPALRQKGGTVGAQRIIAGTKTLWREAWLADVGAFFADPANHVASAERTLAQSLELIRLGLAFRRAQQEKLSAWLRGVEENK